MNHTTEINIGLNAEAAMIARIRKLLISKGIYANIQPFEIRVEFELQGSESSFNWELARRSNQTPRENYLIDNDAFILMSMGIGMFKANNVPTGNFDRGGNTYPLFFPDQNVFAQPATAVNVSEAEALEAVYNGFLKVNQDVNEVLFRLNTERFRITPETQTNTVGPLPITKPNYMGEQYVNIPVPTLFEGKSDNTFRLELAPKADTTLLNGDPETTSTQNFLVILHRGIVIRQYSEPTTIQEIRNSGLVAMTKQQIQAMRK
jgi:hypothetical protein